MTDDKIAKDTARDPEREALGRLRGGIRAAAKKAVRKVTKKAGQKKTAKKATAAAGKTTAAAGKTTAAAGKTTAAAGKTTTAAGKTTTAAGKTTARSTRSAKKADKTAPAGTEAPASRAAAARTSAAKASAVPARTATARASGRAASTPAAPAAAPQDPGPSIETPRPRAPIHPGAAMDSMQEHVGGLGSLLALWGPLIIVGFLVLVFRGGDEDESTVATGAGNPSQSPEAATIGMARGSGPSGAAEASDGAFAMRTSMAGPPVFAGREPGAGMPRAAPGRFYPSPPGPYRDPRNRGLPTGESWSADSADEWMWSAEGRAGPQRSDGGDAPVQWVRCAAPFYWCPTPSSPAW